MKDVLFNKSLNLNKRVKELSIKQENEDNLCVTYVNKHFLYYISKFDPREDEVREPQISIVKNIDTKNLVESFNFQVKGSYLITIDRKKYKVFFKHRLNIRIEWKKKIFSPKKSEILTE